MKNTKKIDRGLTADTDIPDYLRDKVNLHTDEVIYWINWPGYMTDRRREKLRRTADGIEYLEKNNDREYHTITAHPDEIEFWKNMIIEDAERNGEEIPDLD